MEEIKPPPRGICPTNIWLAKRVQEIDDAIHRFQETSCNIPES